MKSLKQQGIEAVERIKMLSQTRAGRKQLRELARGQEAATAKQYQPIIFSTSKKTGKPLHFRKVSVDATSDLIFEVTRKEVDDGIPLDKCHCPIKLGISRVFPIGVIEEVEVGATITILRTLDPRNHQIIHTRYQTPPVIREGLKRYDATKLLTGIGVWDLELGTYRLTPPIKSNRKPEINKRNARNKTRNIVKYSATGRNKRRSLNPRKIVFDHSRKMARAIAI
jgi:hypothetical protein